MLVVWHSDRYLLFLISENCKACVVLFIKQNDGSNRERSREGSRIFKFKFLFKFYKNKLTINDSY